MKIVMKKLADLKTPDYNVRRHSDKQIKEFIRSLDKFEQTRPFVIDENNIVLVGNGMLEAMIQKGEEMGACIVKTGLSEADKKKLMLSDNRIFDLGVNDIAAFDAIIAELDGDFDIPGYDDSFLDSLTADAEEISAVLSEYGTVDEDAAEVIRTAENTPVRPVQTAQSEPSPESPVATCEEAPESGETPAGRFVICPNCGERIWL